MGGAGEHRKNVMAAPDGLHLHTRRNVGPKTHIVGAPGANPTQQVLFDFAGHRPMLAFTVDIEP